MATALVTGATSQIGDFLLPRLMQAGLSVIALSRRPRPPGLPQPVRWVRADIGADPALPGSALERIWERVWVCFHLAPLPLLPALIPRLSEWGVERLLAFGSTSRFAKAGSGDPHEQALVAALVAAEAALRGRCEESGIAWTLFRPTLVYGCGRDANVSLIRRFIERFGFFPVAGKGSGLRQPVHADDLAAACIEALRQPLTFNRAYDLSGGSTLSYTEMVQAIFRSLGRAPRIVHVPPSLYRAGMAALSRLPRYRFLSADMADRMNQDLRFDHGEASRDFGFSPRPFAP